MCAYDYEAKAYGSMLWEVQGYMGVRKVSIGGSCGCVCDIFEN